MNYQTVWKLGALAAGALLGLMIFCNGELARFTNPTLSSLAAHGIGSVVAWILWKTFFAPRKQIFPLDRKVPWAFYLAGVPGALTVILASRTVNSEIGFAGSIALIILGQVAFGIVVDIFGLFSMNRRTLTVVDFGQLFFTMTGTAILIFFAR